MPRSFYDILDVPFDASADEIKKAYRRWAKRVHPDLSAESGDRFKELQSAYEVLSDSDKRRAYDQSLRPRAVSWTGGWSHPYQVRDRAGSRAEAIDPLDPLVPVGDRHLTRDHMDLILTRDEARSGGEFGVELPVSAPCGCIAWGGLAGCLHCRGTGNRRRLESVHLRVPAGVAHGHLLVGRLSDGRELRVRVRLSR